MKRYIITGATGEIGFALTQTLLNRKDTEWIIVVYKNAEKWESMISALPKTSIPIIPLQKDLDNFELKLEELLFRGELPNVFIHTAAVFQSANYFEDISETLEQSVYQVKVFAWKKIASLLLPSMKSNNDGILIGISSRSGILPYAYRTAYAGANAALIHESASLALELQEYNIRTHVLTPGPIEGERLEQIIKERALFTGRPTAVIANNFKKDTVKQSTFLKEIATLLD